MQTIVNEVAGELSQEEAQVAGAFPEDALTEEDALASVGDDAESPAEALHAHNHNAPTVSP